MVKYNPFGSAKHITIKKFRREISKRLSTYRKQLHKHLNHLPVVLENIVYDYLDDKRDRNKKVHTCIVKKKKKKKKKKDLRRF